MPSTRISKHAVALTNDLIALGAGLDANGDLRHWHRGTLEEMALSRAMWRGSSGADGVPWERHALPPSGLGLAVMDRSAATQAHRKTWSDLTRCQRVGIGVVAALEVSLKVAALVDLYRRSAREVNGEKRMWVALSFVNFLGPAAYFKFGRRVSRARKRRRQRRGITRARPS